MQADGSRKLRNATLTCSFLQCSKRSMRPLLSSSAQVFFSPGRCVTRSSTWCRADHAAGILREVPSGSAVLQSFSVPASAAVLSEAPGSARRHCLASCASVSKHAMCLCAGFCSAGQRPEISYLADAPLFREPSAVRRGNKPSPTMSPSNRASAAAQQCNMGFCLTLRRRSCEKHAAGQSSACFASARKCISERLGAKILIHCVLCKGGTRGKFALQLISEEPNFVTLAPSGSQSPMGCAMTVALHGFDSVCLTHR